MPPKTPKLGEAPQDAAAAAPADDTSAVVDGLQNRLKKYLDDVRNPDSKYNRAFQAIRFEESELEREEFDDNPQLFVDYLFGKNQDLQEYLNSFPEEDRADIKEKIIERIKKETYPKWKEGHKMYCPDTAKLLIDNGKEVVDEMKFVEDELEREELDEDDEKLMEFILKKSPELAEFRKQLGGKALKKFDEEVMGKAKAKWKEGHKMYCPDTAKLLIDNGKEIVNEMKFVEEELDREELDDDDQKLEAFLLEKSPELAEFRNQLGGKALKKFDEEVVGKAKAKWKEGHKVYCPETAKLTIKEGADIASDMKFSDGELGKDELHDNPDELKKFLLAKDGLGGIRDGLRGKALKKFDEEVTEPLMKRWREEHEAYEFNEHQQKILVSAQKGEIPPEVKDPNLGEAAFIAKYFDLLADQEDELKQTRHADLRKKLSEDQQIADAIKSRYAELHQGAKLEEVKGEIDQALKGIRFTPEEVGEDKYHDDPDAFVEAFKDRIGDELTAKIEAMGGANKEAGRAYLLQQLKEVLYPQWKDQHEARELEEKKGELLERLRGKVPPKLAQENIPADQFAQRLFDHSTAEDDELKDPKHKSLREKLFADREVTAALQLSHQHYQQQAAERIKTAALEASNKLEFTQQEIEREEFHGKPELFVRYLLEQRLAASLEPLGILDAGQQKNVREALEAHIGSEVYPGWKAKHEAHEEQEISQQLLSGIEQGKTQPEWMEDPLRLQDFFQPYLALVMTAGKIAFDEPHHQAMKERILGSAAVRSALTKRHETYWQELKTSARAELDRELSAMTFIDQERDNDDFHENPKAFADAMQDKLPGKLRSRLSILDGDGSELNKHLRKQLEGEVYQRWLTQHESAEEKKFIDELSGKILFEPITPDFAQEHYEEDEFRQALYERIAGKLSPDLREEHREVIEGLLEKNRVQEAFRQKFQEYEPIHEQVLEGQFTVELSELMRATKVPDDWLKQDMSPTEFSGKYFALLLSLASPKLREELAEHPQLERVLFDKRELQTGIQERYGEYQQGREKLQLEAATTATVLLMKGLKIPTALLKKGLDSPEFQQYLIDQLQTGLTPELKKLLTENKAFQEKVWKTEAVQRELTQKQLQPTEKAEKKEADKVTTARDRSSIASIPSTGNTSALTEATAEAATPGPAESILASQSEAKADISDAQIETLTASPIGKERLDSLRQSFGLRTLLRRREQFFTVFFQKWLSTISDYEFRHFSRLVRKRGTTPQQIIAAMSTNSHRKVRLQKLKFLNQPDWRRFMQGLQYIRVKPEDLLAGRLSAEPLSEQKSKTAALVEDAIELPAAPEVSLLEEEPVLAELESEESSSDFLPEPVLMRETASADEKDVLPFPMAEPEQADLVEFDSPLPEIAELEEELKPDTENEFLLQPLPELSGVQHDASAEEPTFELSESPDQPQEPTLEKDGQEIRPEGQPLEAVEETPLLTTEETIEEIPAAISAEQELIPPQTPVEDLDEAESVFLEAEQKEGPPLPNETDEIQQGVDETTDLLSEQAEELPDEQTRAVEHREEDDQELEVQLRNVLSGIDREARSLRVLQRELEQTMRILQSLTITDAQQRPEIITWVAERLRRRILIELMQQIGRRQASSDQLHELLYRYQLLMLRLADEEKSTSLEDDQGGDLRQRIMLGTLLNRFFFAIRLQSIEAFETTISIDSTCLGSSVTNAEGVYAELWQQYVEVLKQKTRIEHIAVSHGKEITGTSRSIVLTIQYQGRSSDIISQKSIPCHLEEDQVSPLKKLREIPQVA